MQFPVAFGDQVFGDNSSERSLGTYPMGWCSYNEKQRDIKYQWSLHLILSPSRFSPLCLRLFLPLSVSVM